MIDLHHQPLLTDFIEVLAQADDGQKAQWLAFNDCEWDVDVAAASLYLQPGPKWVLTEDERPLALGGFTLVRPGVYRDWMAFAPEAFIRRWRTVSKYSRRVMDGMFNQGAHRLECVCLASRTDVEDWYAFLGYGFEGTLRAAGVHGEDLASYSRVRGI